MHRQALIASLPMTLSPKFHGDLQQDAPRHPQDVANAIHLAPLIAEWRGTRTPTLLFGGRRGQLMTLDSYDNDLGNYNVAIIGTPGLRQVGADERDGLVVPWPSARRCGCSTWGARSRSCAARPSGMYIEFRPRLDDQPQSLQRRSRAVPTVEGINEDIDMLMPALAKMCSMGGRSRRCSSRPSGPWRSSSTRNTAAS